MPRRRGRIPVQLAVTGGEDYELLFTVPPARQPALERQAKTRKYRVTRIGVIRPQRSGLRDKVGGPAPCSHFDDQLRALPMMTAPQAQPASGSSRSFRALLRQVLHLRESPQRTAAAFALGVFIAFSPAYGLHTVMVVLCTWLFGLNFVALMAGAFLNNPWTDRTNPGRHLLDRRAAHGPHRCADVQLA